MRDMIVEAQAHEARSRFTESINQNDILKLASSYRGNEPAGIFHVQTPFEPSESSDTYLPRLGNGPYCRANLF
ncbi:hypothetical protein BGZ61DRAFT_465101 [Ilyonectria robusta]|uniref:uncharacterized protein n=1 Tax=Ilyonectria robusta TaxID=1079257 RepID=UPI001E8D8BDA|nr:uncharacterized protein BGZ61DRAFT_465101 [Ilyonectria robusta]KAH8659538.1 hypothetical protein BGZ61DRAFT_465101 [Ilyonectria robusta]